MKYIFTSLIILCLFACTSKVDEAKEKKAKAARIKDSTENTPDKLIAKLIIEFDKQDYQLARKTIAEIKKRHPNSSEAIQADSINTAINEEIAYQDKIFKEAMAYMKPEKDDISGITKYRAKTAPVYVNRNGFFLTFTSTGSLWLHIQYYGEDWLFIDSYTVKADGQTFEITPTEVERDNEADVWEWSVIGIGDGSVHCEMLNAIAGAQEVTVRSHGKQYYKDRKLNKSEITAFKNTLYAFWGQGWKACR